MISSMVQTTNATRSPRWSKRRQLIPSQTMRVREILLAGQATAAPRIRPARHRSRRSTLWSRLLCQGLFGRPLISEEYSHACVHACMHACIIAYMHVSPLLKQELDQGLGREVQAAGRETGHGRSVASSAAFALPLSQTFPQPTHLCKLLLLLLLLLLSL